MRTVRWEHSYTHRSCLLFGNAIVLKEMSSLLEDQVREFTEQNLVDVKKKNKPTALSHPTGQLLQQKIIRKGKVVLRELDLAVYQM